jgi:hypothetical protein
VLVFDKVPVLYRPFGQRLKYLYKLRDMDRSMFPTCKPFYPLCHIDMVVLDDTSDGYIFIHVNNVFESGASTTILKWKPQECISVDLLVDSAGKLWMQQKMDRFEQFRGTVCEFELRLADCVNKVVEFSNSSSGWFPYRIREDKHTPNSSHVVQETVESASDPVSKEMLFRQCKC